MIISDVMTPCPYTISSDKSMEEASKQFDLRNIRHLPVVKGAEVVGLITKRDVALGKLLCESTGFCPTVGELCTVDPYIVNSVTSLGEVTEEMAERKIDCALVVDNEANFVGIFTTIDACKVVRLLLGENQ